MAPPITAPPTLLPIRAPATAPPAPPIIAPLPCLLICASALKLMPTKKASISENNIVIFFMGMCNCICTQTIQITRQFKKVGLLLQKADNSLCKLFSITCSIVVTGHFGVL
ncbi:hypothetical protein D0C36_11155 [Mucilaginibacter conchicola]|uniref:Uncharacterized protein n=1 Tax=Mucilaginibacter conchicola TaxID=2303333 RepID=A0A372NTT3_9SPHI|nr:hypothetical protein D0C36_11155 [Mucilaginibacter conchicola]